MNILNYELHAIPQSRNELGPGVGEGSPGYPEDHLSLARAE